MVTKLSIYNSALAKMKQRPIATLSSTDPSRLAIDMIYADVLGYMLEQGDWNFAQRTVALTPSISLVPTFGFTNAFEQPTDWVRLISISPNPYLWPPMTAGQFAYDGANQCWEADCNPLYVSYVSDDTSYGGDLAKWTATYADAVAWEIAARIAPALSNLSDADFQRIVQLGTRALRNCKAKDASNQAGQQPPPGSLVMSRRNWRSRTLWER